MFIELIEYVKKQVQVCRDLLIVIANATCIGNCLRRMKMKMVLYNISWVYYEDRDETKAFKWYKKSAEQGHIDAQKRLDFFYEHGLGL